MSTRPSRWIVAIVAIVVLLAPAAARGAEIRAYEVRLEPSATGDAAGRASVLVRLDQVAPGGIAIPLGFASVSRLEVAQAPAGCVLEVQPGGAQALLRVRFPEGTPASATVAVAFDVTDAFRRPPVAAGQRSTLPPGSLTFRHALMNSQPATIRGYRFEVIFPAAVRAHAIREALPKPGRNEAQPRVQLDAVDGRSGARLQAAALPQGETASMQIELAPRSRSAGWLAAGLILSLLYLIHFRDLVARRPRTQR